MTHSRLVHMTSATAGSGEEGHGELDGARAKGDEEAQDQGGKEGGGNLAEEKPLVSLDDVGWFGH